MSGLAGPTFTARGARLAVANLGGLASAAAALLGRDGTAVCAALVRQAARGGAGLPALTEAGWATLAPLGIGRPRLPAAAVLDGLLRGAEYDAQHAAAAVEECRAAAAEVGEHAGELEEDRGPLTSALWGRALLVAVDEWWVALTDAYHKVRPTLVRGDVEGAAALLEAGLPNLGEILERLDVLAHRVSGQLPSLDHAPGAAMAAALRQPLPPAAVVAATDPAWDRATSSGVWDPSGALEAPQDAPVAWSPAPSDDEGGWGPAAGQGAAAGAGAGAAPGGHDGAGGVGEAAAAAAGVAAAALTAKAGAAAVSGVKNLASTAGVMARGGGAGPRRRRGPAANPPRLPSEPRPLGDRGDADDETTGLQARVAVLPEAPAPVAGPIPGRVLGVLKRKPPREHHFLPVIFLVLVVGTALAVVANVLGLLPLNP